MINLRHVVLLACLAMQPAIAAEPQASEASVRELITLTQSEKLVDSIMGQIDAMMQSATKQALEGQTLTATQQKVMDDWRAKIVALFREDMKIMEPVFIDIYRQSFTQKEINGMLDFYKSEPGQAVIAKMPGVLQNTMQAMQGRILLQLPKLQQLQRDAIAALKASPTK